MSLRTSLLIPASLLIFSCGGSIDVGSIGPTNDSGTPAPGTDPVSGLSCSALHGTATLGLRAVHGWPACAFSFRHASQDPAVTRNLFDVYYETDLFMSELAANDPPGSFLVDLGDVPLKDVPAMVDPEKYPTGQWSKHDALQAQPSHTYFQRLVRTDGNSVATFRVKGLVPGDRVTIEWVHSPNADTMVTPRACLP